MALEEIDVAPTIESYKPLSEHEEQTPPTFFGGPPVLYLYSPKATVVVSKSQLEETPVLKRLRSAESTDELDGEANVDIAIDNVDIWVSSRNLILFSPGRSGVSISYPSIALHAMGTHESKHLPDGASPVVFLQVNIHDPETTNSDDEIHTLDLTIYTTAIAVGPSQSSAEDADAPSPVKTLFEALSACADLHPDPNEDDAAEGGNTEPGAGGWITAENMNDFLDADGNFVAPTTLGPGAGNVHSLEDEEDESKWRRTT